MESEVIEETTTTVYNTVRTIHEMGENVQSIYVLIFLLVVCLGVYCINKIYYVILNKFF